MILINNVGVEVILLPSTLDRPPPPTEQDSPMPPHLRLPRGVPLCTVLAHELQGKQSKFSF